MSNQKPYYNDIKFLNVLFDQKFVGHQFKMDILDLISYRVHTLDRIGDEIEFSEIFEMSGDDSTVLYQTSYIFEFERRLPESIVPELQYRLMLDIATAEGDSGKDIEGIITLQKIYPVAPNKTQDTFVVATKLEPFFNFILSVLLDAVDGVLYNGNEGAYEDREEHTCNLRSRLAISERKSWRDRKTSKGDASGEDT